MTGKAMLLCLAGMAMAAGSSSAREIHLDIGESFRQDDVTVTCGAAPASGETPLALKGCQYWDDFNNKCLFAKTTYIYKRLECVEECQHWDKFTSTCLYQSKCAFHPSQGAFVQTSCEKFDDFNDTCLQTKDRQIGR